MARQAKLSALSALAASILALAGCSDDAGPDNPDALSDAEYEQAVNEILKPAGEKLIVIGAEVGSSSRPMQIADVFTRAQAELDSLSGRLGELEAPDDAAAANDDLIDAIDEFNGNFESIREAAEAGEDRAVLEAQGYPEALATFRESLQEVNDELLDQGIDIAGVDSGP